MVKRATRNSGKLVAKRIVNNLLLQLLGIGGLEHGSNIQYYFHG